MVVTGRVVKIADSRMKQVELMIRDIEADVRLTSKEIGKTSLDKRVLDVMREVPRHRFVTPDLRDVAYENRPLPIGEGQTISQPYIVALMTDLLVLDKEDIVLEVGTGSGYQTAILAKLARRVFSVEVIDSLRIKAAKLLDSLGYHNVTTCYGDGYTGLAEYAPYDAIIVTAAAPFIPDALTGQLKAGGKMVIPLGTPGFSQELFLVEKDNDGNIKNTSILAVSFVPLVHA